MANYPQIIPVTTSYVEHCSMHYTNRLTCYDNRSLMTYRHIITCQHAIDLTLHDMSTWYSKLMCCEFWTCWHNSTVVVISMSSCVIGTLYMYVSMHAMMEIQIGDRWTADVVICAVFLSYLCTRDRGLSIHPVGTCATAPWCHQCSPAYAYLSWCMGF